MPRWPAYRESYLINEGSWIKHFIMHYMPWTNERKYRNRKFITNFRTLNHTLNCTYFCYKCTLNYENPKLSIIFQRKFIQKWILPFLLANVYPIYRIRRIKIFVTKKNDHSKRYFFCIFTIARIASLFFDKKLFFFTLKNLTFKVFSCPVPFNFE